uniref:Amino acid transporter transmembrane domain-containing protein n=1 Tax=Araucaria cunninghamii TaxID=56994 RepID=A0A0D6QW94_ARACU
MCSYPNSKFREERPGLRVQNHSFPLFFLLLWVAMDGENPQRASFQVTTNDSLENGNSPALKNFDDDGHPKRTGTMWTASAHIITAVIGSGVLSLAWCMAQLGWVIGPGVLVAFSLVTFYTSSLLTDCYRSPDPVKGRRNYTYMDAVKANLGSTQIWLCGLTQYSNLYGTAIGYTITASISMVAIKRSDCFHSKGKEADCEPSNNPYMILFGAIQILLSQIPDFDKLWWLSLVAAVMSFSYSTIGLGLAVGKVAEGNFHGTLTGVTVGTISSAQKVWRSFQALGDVAFAYSYSMILIEIQDTVKSPPSENKTMKKATAMGVSITTGFYMLSGVLGYAAFGNSAPGNFLTGFGFYNPFWLVDFANACIVVHLIGAYQVFVQPLFAFIEGWCRRRWPKSKFIHMEHNVKLPGLGVYRLSLFRLVWRTCFVITTTLISMLLPFFNDVVALLGAIGFWPLTVYFPVEMYIVQTKIPRYSTKWIILQILSIVCLLVSLAAAVGAIEGITQDFKTYKPFRTAY